MTFTSVASRRIACRTGGKDAKTLRQVARHRRDHRCGSDWRREWMGMVERTNGIQKWLLKWLQNGDFYVIGCFLGYLGQAKLGD